LSVALLDQHRYPVEDLKRLARSLGIGLGWHYLLDLTWILAHLTQVRGSQILDAGAGEGLLQWHLAEQGAQVISVDRSSRAELSLRYRARYHVDGLRPKDLAPGAIVWRRNLSQALGLKAKLASFLRGAAGLLATSLPIKKPGKILIYNQDLSDLPQVSDASQDAVVAVSALEHNTPEGLVCVVDELLRVLKPGGLLLATLGAARDADWFHEPSKGWCYTDATLKRIFHLDPAAPSNFDDHDELFDKLMNCAELRDNLAGFYFQSGDNGMPWGKWDPQYQPVGVCKLKE
jgi:SAM-dependent methyltransferase